MLFKFCHFAIVKAVKTAEYPNRHVRMICRCICDISAVYNLSRNKIQPFFLKKAIGNAKSCTEQENKEINRN